MKFQLNFYGGNTYSSHPVRGAWIEIPAELGRFWAMLVAPREGCVD